MDRAGDEFLACPAFAADEDDGVRFSDLLDIAFQTFDFGAAADNFGFEFELRLEVTVLVDDGLEAFFEDFPVAHREEDLGELVGQREGVFKVFGCELVIEIGGVQVDEAEDLFAATNGSADDAFGLDLAQAVAGGEA